MNIHRETNNGAGTNIIKYTINTQRYKFYRQINAAGVSQYTQLDIGIIQTA